VNAEGVPRRLKVRGHAATHEAQPDEPDLHVVLLSRQECATGAGSGEAIAARRRGRKAPRG
jgi:hypothetical protein